MHHPRESRRVAGWLPALAAACSVSAQAVPCASPISSGWQPVQALTSVETGWALTLEPALAVNAGGAVVVAWHTQRPRPDTQPTVYDDLVQVARYLPCQPWTVRTLTPTLSIPPQGAPVEAAIDAMGWSMVAWRTSTGAQSAGLAASVATANGDWGPGTVVAASGPDDWPVTYRLRMTQNQSGSAFLAWTDANKGLQVQRNLPAFGWTSPLQLEPPHDLYTLSFNLATTGTAAFVHWRTQGYKNRVRRYAGAWQPVLELPPSRFSGPLATDATTGRAVVATWQTIQGVRLTTYDPATGWGPDVAVPGFERSLGLAMDSAGRAAMFGGVVANGIAAMVRRSDGSWLAPVTLGGIAEWPALFEEPLADIGIDGKGRALVVWHEASVIWARRYLGPCTGFSFTCGWGPVQALSEGPIPAMGRPRVAVWPDGRALVVWRQGFDIYLRRYLP